MWDQRLKGHLEHELFYVVKAMFWTGKNRGVMDLLSGSYVAMLWKKSLIWVWKKIRGC